MYLFLFQDFCPEIGMSENPSSTGYALHFEYMYIFYNYNYYPKHFWTIRYILLHKFKTVLVYLEDNKECVTSWKYCFILRSWLKRLIFHVTLFMMLEKLGCAINFVHFHQQNAFCWATSLMCFGWQQNFHYLLMAE